MLKSSQQKVNSHQPLRTIKISNKLEYSEEEENRLNMFSWVRYIQVRKEIYPGVFKEIAETI